MDANDNPEKTWPIEWHAAIFALMAVGAAGFNSLTDYFVPFMHLKLPGAKVWVSIDVDSPYYWEFAKLAPSIQQEYRANLQSYWKVNLVR